MRSTTIVLCARMVMWLTVAATLVAVLRGAGWGWLLAAAGLALTADVLDRVRWPALRRAEG